MSPQLALRERAPPILHDHLQQLLVGARLGTDLIRLRACSAELQPSIEHILALLDESINVSRSLAVELSPPVLHEAGVVAAVRWLGDWMSEHHGMTIELEAPEQIAPDREGLSVLLFESIRELLLNVVKHAGVKTAQVSIVVKDRNRIEVAVTDHGSGFDPAQVLGNSAAAGFGLFSISERMGLVGGRAVIQSAPGVGTRVILTAPLPKAAPARAHPAASSAPAVAAPAAVEGSSPIRVVVADDYPITRQGLIRLLGEEPDIEIVGEACDGREAVEIARRLHPDIMIMDVSMPRLNGIEATREIRATAPGVRVIGLSMYQEEEWAIALKEAGAVAYLRKTGQSKDVAAAIRAAVRAPNA